MSRAGIAGPLAVAALILSIAGCGESPQPGGPPPQRFEAAVPSGFFGVNGQGL